MRLLLLEDDPILGSGLCAYLRADGNAVDWRQPDGSGLDWVQALRRGGNKTPVVVLTARDLLGDRIRGLVRGR